MRKRASDKYFDDYGNVQQYKHDLLTYYLGGWLPKLADCKGGILYCETHAGRGLYRGGEKGSPILALESVLNHPQRETILRKCEVHFLFMEIDPEHARMLRAAVGQISRPARIHVRVEDGDFKELLRANLELLGAQDSQQVPALTFIDPFGYVIPIDLVQVLLARPHGEVLVTFMSKHVAMAMRDESKAAHLDSLYGGQHWERVAAIDDFEARMLGAIELYREVVSARWSTSLRLRGQTEYALVHFTNHDDGRELMKRTMWRADHSGRYQVFSTQDPRQLTLLEVEASLDPLEHALRREFGGRSATYEGVRNWLLATDYRETHLHALLALGRRAGWVQTRHRGRFGPAMKERMEIARVTGESDNLGGHVR